MKNTKFLIVALVCAICISCTNNNQNTGGIDSASVSTDPTMQGTTDTMHDSGMSASDSTDIRMPMAKDSIDSMQNSLQNTPPK
jgi:hypothetical protein